MRLAPKIFTASALIVAVLAVVAGWSLLAVDRLVDTNRDIATRSVPALRLESALRESVRGLVRLETRYLLLKDRGYRELWSERAARGAQDFEQLRAYLDSDEEMAAHRDTMAAFAEYRRHVDAEHALLERGRGEAALRVSETRARAAAERVETGLARITAATDAAVALSQARARALERRTWQTVSAAIAVGLLLALLVSALLAYRMTRSLRRLSAATKALADGTFTESLPAESHDEIGDLARSFNRMAERLREVDRLKEEFFSHVSHDLRNPLASIRLAAEALLERGPGAGDPKQVRFLRLIDASAERMLGMVRQILEYTRLRARLLPLARKPVDLAAIVARATDELHPLAAQQRVGVELVTDGADFIAMCDEESMVRVVINLLGNAIKFTAGGGSVTLRLADRNEHIELTVEDTGIGIPPEALPWIFDPYRQAHGRRQGIGLGLAVVKGVVEAHGGGVQVESEPGKGSRFVVTIPKTEAA